MRGLAVIVGIVGLLALAVGIVYFVVPAHSLPSFMGTIAHSNGHRAKRGVGAVVVGAVLVVVAVVMAVVGGNRSRVRW